jgi:hypothetical protein
MVKKYGTTIDKYDQMFEDQNGRCAICNKHRKEFSMEKSIEEFSKKVEEFKMNAWLRNFRDEETSIRIIHSKKPWCREKKCKVYVFRFTPKSFAVVGGIKHSLACIRKMKREKNDRNKRGKFYSLIEKGRK